jgi:hypothetical protein
MSPTSTASLRKPDTSPPGRISTVRSTSAESDGALAIE